MKTISLFAESGYEESDHTLATQSQNIHDPTILPECSIKQEPFHAGKVDCDLKHGWKTGIPYMAAGADETLFGLMVSSAFSYAQKQYRQFTSSTVRSHPAINGKPSIVLYLYLYWLTG